MPTFNLTPEERETIRLALGDLKGQARRTERGRLRSKVLRQRPDFRQADNAAKAARGKERYHENLEENRRKGAEKWQRRREARAAKGTSQIERSFSAA